MNTVIVAKNVQKNKTISFKNSKIVIGLDYFN